ncbi:hypothetical protein TNCV_159981 [Trichonephila clavipes]|uniref:Uncharacterized protein n=1 Tax=Trichonephila clavipes TaxID=2585209 RepID=A0A8X6V027_TRICX|nr:hypothetical protein TNCV_159981 [Trichonephila clavipes]
MEGEKEHSKARVVDDFVNLEIETEAAKIKLGSGWPSHVGDQAIRSNPNPSMQELVETFNVLQITVERRLDNLVFTRKVDSLVPQNLTAKQRMTESPPVVFFAFSSQE